jgi:hypothetical protein
MSFARRNTFSMIPVKQYLVLLVSILLFSACNKEKSGAQSRIDVSEQWSIDALGNLVFGYADGQWQSRAFTPTEQDLFASLDTANLSGTTQPAVVYENTLNYNSVYPNPFVGTGGHRLIFHFSPGYSGQLVLKMVYVDSLLQPLYKTVARFHASPLPLPTPAASDVIAIYPTLPIGRFRVYYTLSAQGSPHFYKTWGDVERTQ